MAFALLIIVIGLALAVFKPVYYVLFFGLFGSDMDALGFVGYFKQYIPTYDTIMLLLLILATASSIFFSRRQKPEYRIAREIRLSYYIMLFSSLSIILFFLFSDADGSILIRVFKAVGVYSPAIMVIWFKQRKSIVDGKDLLFKYLCIQCLIAFGIIYLSRVGISFFNLFNAGYYNGGYYYTNEYNDMVALPSNFYRVFTEGKNANFVRTGQFHNSNGLGFAAATLVFLCIERLVNTKESRLKRIITIALAIMAFFLWCCSGTRGVLFGIMIGFAVYLLKMLIRNRGRMNSLWSAFLTLFLSIGIIGMLILSVFDNFIGSYLTSSGILGSFATRNFLLGNFVNSLFSFLLVGNGGNLDVAVKAGIDPHIISLRILVMYGIIPAILMFVMTLLRPIKRLIDNSISSLYIVGLTAIIIMVGSTNNFTAVVLFWIILAESICRIEDQVLENTEI